MTCPNWYCKVFTVTGGVETSNRQYPETIVYSMLSGDYCLNRYSRLHFPCIRVKAGESRVKR